MEFGSLVDIVKVHLREYLLRTQELWKLYNLSVDNWIIQNPNHDGAPRSGSFNDVGITRFSRHGFGIRIECKNEIVEFDFIATNIDVKHFLDIEEIDIYWSYNHYRSLNSTTSITHEQWLKAIEFLDKKGDLKMFSRNRCAFYGFNLKE